MVMMALFVCLVGFLTSSLTTRLYRGRAPKQSVLTILRAATHKTEQGDHDFCLSRSHYTDTDPTRREQAATAGIKPRTSSPGVACSTDWATAPCDDGNDDVVDDDDFEVNDDDDEDGGDDDDAGDDGDNDSDRDDSHGGNGDDDAEDDGDDDADGGDVVGDAAAASDDDNDDDKS